MLIMLYYFFIHMLYVPKGTFIWFGKYPAHMEECVCHMHTLTCDSLVHKDSTEIDVTFLICAIEKVKVFVKLIL